MNKKLLTKVLLVTLLVLTFTGLLIPRDKAQAVVVEEHNTAGDAYLGSVTYEDGKFYKNGFVLGISHAVSSELAPRAYPIGELEDGTQLVYYYQDGAAVDVANLTQEFYDNPPASGIVYAQSQWEQITTGHVVHAQDAEDSWVYYPGLGFNILNPIQHYWSITRNIAYIAMIIIIVIIAFLIAFRQNFGGQTQVTIANSIPNIIVALLMITISYPLSGLAIDFITLGCNMVQQVLVQNTWSPGYENVWEADDLNAHLFGFNADTSGPSETAAAAGIDIPEELNFEYQTEGAKYHVQPDDQAMSVWQAFGTSGVDVVNLPGEDGKGFVATVIPKTGFAGDSVKTILINLEPAVTTLVQLVFVIAAFMTSVKLFFKLITKYLVLLVYPVVSPFVMLTIAIPGRGTSAISNYFKTLFGASLSFVSIYAVFLFMTVLTRDTYFSENINFAPPSLGFDTFNTSGRAVGVLIQMILAFALFITTPAIPDMIDAWLGTLDLNERKPIQLAQGALQGGWGGGVARTKSVLGRVVPGQRKK